MMLVATIGMGAGWSALSSAADSGTYPPAPGAAAISVDKPTPAVGDQLTVTATGLCAGQDVAFELTGSSAPTLLASPALTAASNGTASFVFTVPGPAGVTRTVWAKQSTCSITLSTTVSVVATPSTTAAPQPLAPSTTTGATTTTVAPTATTTPAGVTLSAAPATPTSPITVSAAGLCASQTTTFTLMSGSNTLSSQGIMSAVDGTATVTFPARPAGDYTVKVTQDCGTSQSLPVTVASAGLVPSATTTPGATGSGLPTTGGEPSSPLQIAAVAVVTGAALALVTRRRKLSFFRQLRRLRALG
jgi:LPXTG-motif cell wall-anchored protein